MHDCIQNVLSSTVHAVTRELHHVGYVVDDLPAAAARFAERFGAGPFYAFEHILFDEVTHRGDPAVYDHSSAFGQCGPIIVELTQVHDVRPAGLASDPLLGHPIEVLQSRDELLGFYDMVRRASEGWDGTDPYRLVTELPA